MLLYRATSARGGEWPPRMRRLSINCSPLSACCRNVGVVIICGWFVCKPAWARLGGGRRNEDSVHFIVYACFDYSGCGLREQSMTVVYTLCCNNKVCAGALLKDSPATANRSGTRPWQYVGRRRRGVYIRRDKATAPDRGWLQLPVHWCCRSRLHGLGAAAAFLFPNHIMVGGDFHVLQPRRPLEREAAQHLQTR